MINEFEIEGLKIGGNRCFIIAEIAQSHDGSLGMAHAYIDAVAKTGADAIKFQTHIAEAESSEYEKWRVKFSPQDTTRMDYWRRMEFTFEQWIGLKKHAEELNLIFLSSPFSYEAFDLLDQIGVNAWKVASGEVNNVPFLKKMAATKKPMLISSGMSELKELDIAVSTAKNFGAKYAVMQCTTEYPTSASRVGLNLIGDFKNRYNCPIGYSDHSGLVCTGIAAYTLGATILENHITMSREMFGPDVSSSLTTFEFKNLVDSVRFLEIANSNPVDKDVQSESLKNVKSIFSKSLFLKENLQRGAVILDKHLCMKKPGGGIHPNLIDQIIGKKMKMDLNKGEMILHQHIE